MEAKKGNTKGERRGEGRREGEGRKEGRFLTIAPARARQRPPAEGRDGNHELGIRGRRERREGGMAGEGMTILGARRRTCEFGTLVKYETRGESDALSPRLKVFAPRWLLTAQKCQAAQHSQLRFWPLASLLPLPSSSSAIIWVHEPLSVNDFFGSARARGWRSSLARSLAPRPPSLAPLPFYL